MHRLAWCAWFSGRIGGEAMLEQTDNTTVYTIDQLRSIIVPYVQSRKLAGAHLFGSYAKGEADGTSDIDILVDKGEARALAVCGLANHVYRATGKMTDVFDIRELDQGPFRDSALRDAVAL